MILSNEQIRQAVAAEDIVITPYQPDLLEGITYPLHLGDIISRPRTNKVINVSSDIVEIDSIPVGEEGYLLKPKDMVVWRTQERVRLSGRVVAEIDGRSRMALVGVMPVAASRFILPGSNEYQELEICNTGRNAVLLTSGLYIGKLLFHQVGEPLQAGSKKGLW
ncbi:MAG TPA: hypothetical protein VFB59_03215 [Candidatus Saccharimonadales bacterium]|nr:hypothetical protein [Candidatus Saccharimonadales bacterium]